MGGAEGRGWENLLATVNFLLKAVYMQASPLLVIRAANPGSGHISGRRLPYK